MAVTGIEALERRFVWTSIVTSFALTALAGCGGGADPDRNPVEPPQPSEVLYGTVMQRDRSGSVPGEDFTAVVASTTAFGLDAYRVLREAVPSSNLAVGTYSVANVLGMLYAGARGATATEMAAALHWTLSAERFHPAMNALDLELLSRGDDVTITTANRVWAQRSIEFVPDYLDVMTRDYGAPVAVADFGVPEEARAAINDWVRSATADKITELFPPGTIDALTRVVLANAMYLDAPWKYQFDPEVTADAPFTLLDGTAIDVPTMHFNEFLPSGWSEEWAAVELPYRGDELSMVVIVPHGELQTFEAGLTPQRLQAVFDSIADGGIHLSLPKFTFSFHTSLVDTLTALGAGSLFAGPDLSGMLVSPGLFVSAVEHEVFIEVDESGTKAAAATGAALADSHGPTVMVDRPFMFVLRDRPTGAVLFMGRVVDPR